MRKVYLLTSLILLLFVGSVDAQTVTVRYKCNRPTVGTIATRFLWSVCLDDSNVCSFSISTPDTFAAITYSSRHRAFVRVAGQDAGGAIGPVSWASLPDGPTAPGGCGRPVKY